MNIDLGQALFVFIFAVIVMKIGGALLDSWFNN